MNILFATLVDINSMDERGIYQDLMRELAVFGHKVFIMSPAEKRQNKQTFFAPEKTGGILKIRVGNIQKTGKIEKGISTLLLEHQYVSAFKKYFSDMKFDLIIYSTPPITLEKLVKYVKKRDGAVSYLLLKDIFPQNAVDLGILRKNSLIYKFFRKKEQRLYNISDQIGCLSNANVKYLLEHSDVQRGKLHVCPNSITPQPLGERNDAADIRKEYGIAYDSKVFVYGGNLGKPQSIAFLISCLELCKDKPGSFFLICGEGTDAGIIEEYIKDEEPKNIKLLKMLPKDEYDRLLSACDIGLIFLDYRFTIPNFPSRLLSYMELGIPVLACTDTSTDVGKVVEEGGFGWWCASDSRKAFSKLIDSICGMDSEELKKMGLCGRANLEENYLASQAAKVILDKAMA